jgi:hypothetical protein
MPLAVLFVAGSLAKRFGILDESVPIAKAVSWAWNQFAQSSVAQALSPRDQALANLRQWIAERWDTTIKQISQAADRGSRTLPMNNRETLGWYDDDTIYLPVRRAREAAGSSITERDLAAYLASQKLLSRRQDNRRIAIRYIPHIGKIDAYALKRTEFGPTRNAVDQTTHAAAA